MDGYLNIINYTRRHMPLKDLCRVTTACQVSSSRLQCLIVFAPGNQAVPTLLTWVSAGEQLQLLKVCTGITWLLSDVVVAMRPDLWAAQYERVAAAANATPHSAHPPPGLREWLAHQKGIHRLSERQPAHCVFSCKSSKCTL